MTEAFERTTDLGRLQLPVCLRCARDLLTYQLVRGTRAIGAAKERIDARQCMFKANKDPYEVCHQCGLKTVAGFYLKPT